MRAKTTKTPHDRQKLPSYPSMAACASGTGIPMEILKSAKSAGCDAFDSHGRVALGKLLAWIFRPESGEDTNWTMRLKRAQALTAELDLAEAQGRLVDHEAVVARARADAERVRSVLDSSLRVELPPRIAGKSAEEIAAAIEPVIDAAYASLCASAAPVK